MSRSKHRKKKLDAVRFERIVFIVILLLLVCFVLLTMFWNDQPLHRPGSREDMVIEAIRDMSADEKRAMWDSLTADEKRMVRDALEDVTGSR